MRPIFGSINYPINYSCIPLTVIATMPARYAAPKIPIPVNILICSFQFKQRGQFLFVFTVYRIARENQPLSTKLNICICASCTVKCVLQFCFVNLQNHFLEFLQLAASNNSFCVFALIRRVLIGYLQDFMRAVSVVFRNSHYSAFHLRLHAFK